MFNVADVVQFTYLWARQSDAGEDAGRYPRPVCVVVKSATAFFLFPITTKAPIPGQVGLAVPPLERRRAGLDQPCWLIPSEFNRVPLDAAYDFARTSTMGSFSPAFMAQIAKAIRVATPIRSVDRA